jgi:ABC-type lipoprotein release transport system permease subunit
VILFRIALRNLASHKLKSFIVGGLLAFGTFLLLIGQALLGTLDVSMARSITGSMAGQLQAYSGDAKDKLALFGDMSGGTDIGTVQDFVKVRKVLEAHPQVEAVVPQGSDVAMVYGGNIIDVKLEELRAAEKAGNKERSKVLRAHLRRIVGLLGQDMAKLGEIADLSRADTETRDSLVHLARAGKDDFWQGFDADPLEAMEFLENEIAPLAMSADMLFFRYMGTDTARFAKAFDLFEIVDGTAIPSGQRGFLFNKLNYEETVKHKAARRLDKMKDRIADGYAIASDDDLKNYVKLNKNQYKDVTYQFDEVAAAAVRKALQQALGSQEQDLDKLVVAFMDMDDGNFAKRYEVFYRDVAPRLMLYSVKIGDVMTIKGFTSSGYPTSVNVKVYGTFRFKSLDKSSLAGAVNVMDLMTYRDLYGYLSADKKAEIEALQAKSGVQEIKRADAEAALFGGDGGEEIVEEVGQPGEVSAAADPTAVQPPPELAKAMEDKVVRAMAAGEAGDSVGAGTAATETAAPAQANGGKNGNGKKREVAQADRVYVQGEIDGGVVRHMAIIVKPGADLKVVAQELQAAADREKLGLKIVDWRTASGFIGDFLWVIYSVLATALLIIFIVAVIVMNNSMVMATLERTKEIGTMRAIGAQKSMILRMFLAEAAVMSAVFGGIGALLAVGTVAWMHSVGLPAANDVLVFLFAGPRLYPELQLIHVLVSAVLVGIVALISTLYPAWLAMRVTPLEAMQDAE